MIIREFYSTRKDGVNLYRTYSDEEFKIIQVETGVIYDDAIDVENANYTYIESEEKIEEIEESEVDLDEREQNHLATT